MTAEYSYFRAKGAALSAIETVVEARAELEQLKKHLTKQMGADDIMAGLRVGEDRFSVVAFVYHKEEQIPQGWDMQRQMNGDKLQAAFGLPPEGTKEYFNMNAMAGLMERHARNARLEYVFEVEEMPRHDLPAGNRSLSFVRYQTSQDGAKHEPGVQRDSVSFMGYSNSPTSGTDPLDFKKLNGNWFIRVPNKKGTEDPVFTPPDAEKMDYQDMLFHDRMETNAARSARFNGPIC